MGSTPLLLPTMARERLKLTLLLCMVVSPMLVSMATPMLPISLSPTLSSLLSSRLKSPPPTLLSRGRLKLTLLFCMELTDMDLDIPDTMDLDIPDTTDTLLMEDMLTMVK